LKSQELFERAVNLENLRSYQEALNNYKQAKQYYSSEKIIEKIFIMKNMLQSQNDPKAFAKKVILEFYNGALANAVAITEQKMRDKYGASVTSSDWKVTFAIGQYKYEVRYDIVSPEETYYFAWTVDIRVRKVMPSNKASEKLMLDNNLLDE